MMNQASNRRPSRSNEIHIHVQLDRRKLLRVLRGLGLTLCLATPLTLVAGTVIRPTPFTFSSGDPLVASEINAIHSAIADAVDANANDIASQASTVDNVLEALCTLARLEGQCDSLEACASSEACANKVFLTSADYRGNLVNQAQNSFVDCITVSDGLEAADCICREHAESANLDGTYAAWISTEITDPASRFSQGGRYILVDGTQIAASWADLTDADGIDAPISLTETGAIGSNTWVWSSTWRDGTWAGISDSTCNDWTAGNSGHTGLIGNALASEVQFWTWENSSTCNERRALYCFQQ